jgi:myo-inositol 2-dehydrogenase/D-chiro-inositol 1-dehydrogenase
MGVHEFDQVRWLTGQEFATIEVASAIGGGAPADDPDCVQVVAELDGGSTAMMSLGRWHPAGDSCKVEVFGTKGTASSWFFDPSGGDAVFRQALCCQAEDFAAAVRGSSVGGASVADAVAAMKIATHARAKQSIRTQ